MFGGIEADGDQYVLHYSTDRVLQQLEVDVDARIRAHQVAWFSNWRCWCPPACLVYNLVCCSSLHMCTRFRHQERAAARAHRLVLREKTLLFEVDEHILPAPQSDGSYLPTCCWPGGCCSCLGGPCGATCGDATHVLDRRTVIRLAELESIGLERSSTTSCGCPSGPDHLVVTVRQSKDEEEALCMLGRHAGEKASKVMAVIAGPKNVAEFLEAVRVQARRVVDEGLDENPPSPDLRDFSWIRQGAIAPIKARRPNNHPRRQNNFSPVVEMSEPAASSTCSSRSNDREQDVIDNHQAHERTSTTSAS